MSNMAFLGGPLDGTVTPPDPMGGMPAAGGAGAPPAEEELTPGQRFERMLQDAHALKADPSISQKHTLLLEKATSLIQQIRADEEREEEQAMTGTLSPGVLRKIGRGGA